MMILLSISILSPCFFFHYLPLGIKKLIFGYSKVVGGGYFDFIS